MVRVQDANRWHYSMVAAQLVPERHHQAVLPVVQRNRQAADIFPTFYRMNSIGACRRVVTHAGLNLRFLTTHEPAPAYLDFSAVAFLMGVVYQRIVDGLSLTSVRKNIVGFAQKPGG